MTIIDLLRNRLLILQYKLGIGSKQSAELSFWLHEIENYKKWYSGRIRFHYGVPSPRDEEKIIGYTMEENAIRTWASVHKDKYLKHLMVPSNIFAGNTVLDIGCGPIPYALGFTDCMIYGLDPLIEAYKKIGYPLDSYSDRIKYIEGYAEEAPFEDDYFDAVISINALDHVDNFPKAASEICRVLKPNGIILLETHYHESRKTEPWSLTDEMIIKHFDSISIEKIHEQSLVNLYPFFNEKDEKLVIWSNIKTCNYKGVV